MGKSPTGITSPASGSEQQLNQLPTLMGFPACAGRTRRRSRRPLKAGARREVSRRHLKDMWASHHFWLNLCAVLFSLGLLARLPSCRRNGLKEWSERREDIKRICGRICQIQPKHMQRLRAENRKGWAFILFGSFRKAVNLCIHHYHFTNLLGSDSGVKEIRWPGETAAWPDWPLVPHSVLRGPEGGTGLQTRVQRLPAEGIQQSTGRRQGGT